VDYDRPQKWSANLPEGKWTNSRIPSIHWTKFSWPVKSSNMMILWFSLKKVIKRFQFNMQPSFQTTNHISILLNHTIRNMLCDYTQTSASIPVCVVNAVNLQAFRPLSALMYMIKWNLWNLHADVFVYKHLWYRVPLAVPECSFHHNTVWPLFSFS